MWLFTTFPHFGLWGFDALKTLDEKGQLIEATKRQPQVRGLVRQPVAEAEGDPGKTLYVTLSIALNFVQDSEGILARFGVMLCCTDLVHFHCQDGVYIIPTPPEKIVAAAMPKARKSNVLILETSHVGLKNLTFAVFSFFSSFAIADFLDPMMPQAIQQQLVERSQVTDVDVDFEIDGTGGFMPPRDEISKETRKKKGCM